MERDLRSILNLINSTNHRKFLKNLISEGFVELLRYVGI